MGTAVSFKNKRWNGKKRKWEEDTKVTGTAGTAHRTGFNDDDDDAYGSYSDKHTKAPVTGTGNYSGPSLYGGTATRSHYTDNGAYSGTGTVVYTQHDHDGEPLFDVDGITIGGGSGQGKHVECPTDLLVDIAAYDWGVKGPETRYRSTGKWEVLDSFFPRQPTKLSVKWPDRDPPPFTPEFLSKVIELVRKDNPKGHIVFSCVGGHGRTGTALAAVRILHLNEKAAQAIAWVRKHYCDRAVESKEQVSWLYRISGEEEPKPAPLSTVSTGFKK